MHGGSGGRPWFEAQLQGPAELPRDTSATRKYGCHELKNGSEEVGSLLVSLVVMYATPGPRALECVSWAVRAYVTSAVARKGQPGVDCPSKS